ncbi:hypothetical protein FACS1894190_04810 [Spirochaetia bacterium]|nr:hypothetical protein FACS1894190_04810 [Spirochaetia bacterium]
MPFSTAHNLYYMLYDKLGCHNLPELVQKAVRNNIIGKRKYCGCPDCDYTEDCETQEGLWRQAPNSYEPPRHTQTVLNRPAN